MADQIKDSFHFGLRNNLREMLLGKDFLHESNCPQEGYTIDEMARILRVDRHLVEDLLLKHLDDIEPSEPPKFPDNKGPRYRWRSTVDPHPWYD